MAGFQSGNKVKQRFKPPPRMAGGLQSLVSQSTPLPPIPTNRAPAARDPVNDLPFGGGLGSNRAIGDPLNDWAGGSGGLQPGGAGGVGGPALGTGSSGTTGGNRAIGDPLNDWQGASGGLQPGGTGGGSHVPGTGSSGTGSSSSLIPGSGPPAGGYAPIPTGTGARATAAQDPLNDWAGGSGGLQPGGAGGVGGPALGTGSSGTTGGLQSLVHGSRASRMRR